MEFKNSRKVKNIIKRVVSISSGYHNPSSYPSYFSYLVSHKVVIYFTYSNGGTCTEEQLSENGEVHNTFYPLNTTVYFRSKIAYLSYK